MSWTVVHPGFGGVGIASHFLENGIQSNTASDRHLCLVRAGYDVPISDTEANLGSVPRATKRSTVLEFDSFSADQLSLVPAAGVGEMIREVVQRRREVGFVGGGVGGGQPPADLGGVLAGGQGLVPAAGVTQIDREVVQRQREGGFVGGGVGGGQPPVDLDGVLDGGQALVPAAGVGQIG